MKYSSIDFLKDKFDGLSRKKGFSGETKEELISWQKRARAELNRLMGTELLGSFKPLYREEEVFKLEDCVKIKACIETAEKLYMPIYVIKPYEGSGIPVIALHGHGCGGKEGLCGGCPDDGKRFNYSYAEDMVKKGFTVFVPDLCGAGERTETVSSERGFGSSCNDINNAAIAMGFSLQTIIVYELMRLIDYIEGAGFKTDKLSVIGFSGGGLSGLLLGALDERVKACYISGYFHGFKETILYNNLCGCNFIPSLWRSFETGDLGAMICPRLLIIENGGEDSLNGISGYESVLSQLYITRKAYKIYGSDNLHEFVGEGGHKFYGLGYKALDEWCKKC